MIFFPRVGWLVGWLCFTFYSIFSVAALLVILVAANDLLNIRPNASIFQNRFSKFADLFGFPANFVFVVLVALVAIHDFSSISVNSIIGDEKNEIGYFGDSVARINH